jgi:nucleotide-binding universal stress UspA family protein
MSTPTRLPELANRFRILVCIDGSPNSYLGLRYALKFNADHEDTDITLLQVRQRDPNKADERLDVDLSQLNRPDIHLELPELRSLETARDILVEQGFLGDDWHPDHAPGYGSRRGSQVVQFSSGKSGQHISMMVRLASSVLAGILEAASEAPYDLVVVSATSDGSKGAGPGSIDLYTAVSVATEHNGSVILARELEAGHGHMICITNAASSIPLALKDAAIAARCGCPIHLYGVTDSDGARAGAVREAEKVREALRADGYEITDSQVEIGDPVERIVEHGQQHSLIVMAATEKSLLKRMFLGSVSHEVLKKAKNSVMIVR